MAKRSSQEAHDTMVENLAKALDEVGLEKIKADHTDAYPRTEIIEGLGPEGDRRPDVTALNNDGQIPVFCIFEVETSDSINDEHTANQWTTFSRYALENEGEFTIIVPQVSKEAAIDRFNELGLQKGRIEGA